jgi:hypothetical protein
VAGLPSDPEKAAGGNGSPAALATLRPTAASPGCPGS